MEQTWTIYSGMHFRKEDILGKKVAIDFICFYSF